MDVVTLGAALNGSKAYTDQVTQSLTGSDIGLAGYTKGTVAKQDVSPTDNVNQGLGKIEKRVSDNENNLSLKANTSDVNTATANLQTQIDEIAQAAGTGSADTEVAQARVGADGISYQTLKARLDDENGELKGGLGQLSESVIELGNGAEKSISEITNDRYIGENGNAIALSTNQLSKYEVSEGMQLYLDLKKSIKVTFQFQNNKSVPTGTNEYIVGEKYSGVINGIYTVPAGATWLIVSQDKDTNNHVYVISKTDKTLTMDGVSADAKVVGEQLHKKIEIPRLSKNICNPNDKTKLYVPNNGNVLSVSQNEVGYIVKVKPNTTYTITKSSGTNRFGIGASMKNNKPASAVSLFYSTSTTITSATVNSGDNIYLYVQVRTSDGVFPDWLQVEEGTEFTGYEEYSPYDSESTYAVKAGGILVKTYSSEEIDNIVNPKNKFMRNVNFGNVSGLSEYYHCFETDGKYNVNTLSSEIYSDFDNLVSNNPNYVVKTDLGASSNNDHLYAYHFKPKTINNALKPIPKVIIISGQHGFEKGAVFGLANLFTDICNKWDVNGILAYLRNNVEFIVIPVVNRYGFDNNIYKNANGVNLNRNYDTPSWTLVTDPSDSSYGGTSPFSEPETIIVRDLILTNKDAIYFADWHTDGRYKVEEYEKLNWVTATNFDKDAYLSKVVDCASYHISNITVHATKDYNLTDIGDALCGYTTIDALPRPTAGAYAILQGIIGHTFETNNGFKNGATLDADCQKFNAEIFGNWLGALFSMIH